MPKHTFTIKTSLKRKLAKTTTKPNNQPPTITHKYKTKTTKTTTQKRNGLPRIFLNQLNRDNVNKHIKSVLITLNAILRNSMK